MWFRIVYHFLAKKAQLSLCRLAKAFPTYMHKVYWDEVSLTISEEELDLNILYFIFVCLYVLFYVQSIQIIAICITVYLLAALGLMYKLYVQLFEVLYNEFYWKSYGFEAEMLHVDLCSRFS